MQLQLIRHTAPLLPSGICYGRSEVAVAQADCLAVAAQWHRANLEKRPIFSSPAQRCRQLAQLLSPMPSYDARLLELDFGSWEMQSWDQIARAEIDAWAADTVAYAPGGRENLSQMVARLRAFLNDLHAYAVDSAVLVTHGGVIRILAAWQPGKSDVQLAQRVCDLQETYPFASFTELEIFL
ncbi:MULTISPECIES: histidine phosphatase family protein [unclassified Undibacterium]|uniref:histidine phosphatase family protein n=1 Tax=unclassified Undibacterium TaxID=2630295 RepID=UPI002AC9722D|nr:MULTISPECIES: histidine phosphatase family protein [unclassified Undibacterium]MEB0139087.1 histidine phosphatase family protein [Undibacterium sp. CCC2.1]MEB0172956.1 histidine phosphatase family protein [Undibacterium sp. CCC1.1]MEB0177278.1 histidine phosphatase family protein [Undibacterium sp. CCC3.4]MEB0215874.1 histidine phosphatase family protein [Undibacterium sp. 5I2]WPX42077.1 histidine phosphatase family protein [Undibacterium sp. CCC3.4]